MRPAVGPILDRTGAGTDLYPPSPGAVRADCNFLRNGLEMTLVFLSVVVIALLIAVMAIYLFAIGVLLNRIANNR